jgi:hypothetical protein
VGKGRDDIMYCAEEMTRKARAEAKRKMAGTSSITGSGKTRQESSVVQGAEKMELSKQVDRGLYSLSIKRVGSSDQKLMGDQLPTTTCTAA